MISLGRRSVALLAAASLLLGGCASEDGGDTGKAASKTIELVAHPEHRADAARVGRRWPTSTRPHTRTSRSRSQPLENEAFKAKLTTLTQSGNAPRPLPDLGRRRAAAAGRRGAGQGPHRRRRSRGRRPHAGRPAAVPVRRQDLRRARSTSAWSASGTTRSSSPRPGITAPPATWTEFLDAVKKLKAAGHHPDRPRRQGQVAGPLLLGLPGDARRRAWTRSSRPATDKRLHRRPTSSQAGAQLKELVDLQPFQKGFLGAGYGTPDGQAATMGNGKAAMELMGQWAPAVQARLDGKKGLGDKLGFFPFPTVDGGKGAATDVFGGGGGFAIGKDAPAGGGRLPEVPAQRGQPAQGRGDRRRCCRSSRARRTPITDANLQGGRRDAGQATGFQLYLDQAYPPAVGPAGQRQRGRADRRAARRPSRSPRPSPRRRRPSDE